MDIDSCNVVYLDRRADGQRTWTRDQPPQDAKTGRRASTISLSAKKSDDLSQSVQALLSVFPQVSICNDSTSCINMIDQCGDDQHPKGVLVLVDIPSDERYRVDSPAESPHTSLKGSVDFDDPYGVDFLIYLLHKIRAQRLSSRVVPIAVRSQEVDSANKFPLATLPLFEAGAADVLVSPLSEERVQSLPSHLYRLSAERLRRKASLYLQTPPPGKKTSWVGTLESKPYTQTKEVMVSELMDHIVNPDREEAPVDTSALNVDPERHAAIEESFGRWEFSAHDFTDDELVYGALRIFEHTLKLPGNEKWAPSRGDLLTFLLATRRVYNPSVLYHNFRHATDVLQATFIFLIRSGAIPPFSGESYPSSIMGSLLDPFHSLVLLIAAYGHDVGHPGVNNGFLVMVNAPLAQLYNDRSVLESFHCAAYSQILRRFWTPIFENRLARKHMITTILATDMGVHGEYMTQVEALQTRCPTSKEDLATWNEAAREADCQLLMCLLIKCADICNVAREFAASSQWAQLLIDEFHAQGQIESDSNVPTSLFGGPPDPTSTLQKARSQIAFVDVFAAPLFAAVAAVLPGLAFGVSRMESNKLLWASVVDEEVHKQQAKALQDQNLATVGRQQSDPAAPTDST